jgi:hypothetical protein
MSSKKNEMRVNREVKVSRTGPRVGSRNWVRHLERTHGGFEVVLVELHGMSWALVRCLNRPALEIAYFPLEADGDVGAYAPGISEPWTGYVLSDAAIDYVLGLLPVERIRDLYLADDLPEEGESP